VGLAALGVAGGAEAAGMALEGAGNDIAALGMLPLQLCGSLYGQDASGCLAVANTYGDPDMSPDEAYGGPDQLANMQQAAIYSMQMSAMDQAYDQGAEMGYDAGQAQGYAQGEAAGYAAGYQAGAAAQAQRDAQNGNLDCEV
jgi:hypothetical protein